MGAQKSHPQFVSVRNFERTTPHLTLGEGDQKQGTNATHGVILPANIGDELLTFFFTATEASDMAPTSTSEPTWEVAKLFPDQGLWSEDDYLALDTNQLIEFSHGVLEFPPMPTTSHQGIAFWLCQLLVQFASPRQLGRARMAPLKIRLCDGKFREPDVVFMLREHDGRIGEQVWNGADIAMEVVSDDDRRRELEIKRREYAQAGIPEYWIVDPQTKTITVLVLDGTQYVEHGVFALGERATSRLLSGFVADVTAIFDAATM